MTDVTRTRVADAVAEAGVAIGVDLTEPAALLIDDLGLDSLLVLELIVKVEDRLGCEVVLASRPVTTVGELTTIFERRLSAPAPEHWGVLPGAATNGRGS